MAQCVDEVDDARELAERLEGRSLRLLESGPRPRN